MFKNLLYRSGIMEIKERKFGKEIRDSSKDYILNLVFEDIDDLGNVFFHIPTPNFSERLKLDHKIPVTSRDWNQYPTEFKNIPLDSTKCYAEIGIGLGEGLIAIGEALKWDTKYPLTVIEPADYSLMLEMLNFAAANIKMPKDVSERVEVLKRRINIITNPKKINLVNKTLGNALADHPQLKGSADYLIDSCGAMTYSETEIFNSKGYRVVEAPYEKTSKARVNELERAILKTDGKLIRF